MTTQFLRADLQRDEGYRLTAYQDGGGVWTIGVGHTPAHQGEVITPTEANALLDADIATAEQGLDGRIPWWRQMNDARQDVMVNMAFNLGIAGLLSFHHTIAADEADNYALAAADMMLTEPWCHQVGARAQRLADQMRAGVGAGSPASPTPAAAAPEPIDQLKSAIGA